MSEQADRTRLQHMLDAARSALSFAEGQSKQALETNQMLVFAVVRAVEIIGEAGSRVSKPFQSAHPQIPWAAIISMRNRLVHAYFEVDLEQVWSVLTDDLPPLIHELEKILNLDSE